MTDINTIKNLFNLLAYIREDTWYMLGTGVTVYVIYVAYLMAFERYYREHTKVAIPLQKPSLHERLQTLSYDDPLFFEKLSLLIRSHLEDTDAVSLATKKTQKEIEQTTISERLKMVLKTCAHYEYTKEEATREEKEQLLEWLKGIL